MATLHKVENDLGIALRAIVRRSVDQSSFLSKEADNAAETMVQFSDPGKAIESLLQLVGTEPHPLVKTQVARLLLKIVSQPGSGAVVSMYCIRIVEACVLFGGRTP